MANMAIIDRFHYENSVMPGFNPLTYIDVSGSCATLKILQCRDYGYREIDVSEKFKRNPDCVGDLSKEEFIARQIVLKQVKDWVEERVLSGQQPHEWVPIAYMYELVTASGKKTRDWGHLLFTDMTTTRFLIVMVLPAFCQCGNYTQHDYDAMTKYQADRLFSLVKYLHYNDRPPKWVRATYVIPNDDYQLDMQLLNSDSAVTPREARDRRAARLPPIFHITSDNFVPSLLSSDVDKIDNLLKVDTTRERIPAEVRDVVVGSKDVIPHTASKYFNQKNVRYCSYCDDQKQTDSMVCSRCKLVYYCSRRCQRLAWPMHKGFCKALNQNQHPEINELSEFDVVEIENHNHVLFVGKKIRTPETVKQPVLPVVENNPRVLLIENKTQAPDNVEGSPMGSIEKDLNQGIIEDEPGNSEIVAQPLLEVVKNDSNSCIVDDEILRPEIIENTLPEVLENPTHNVIDSNSSHIPQNNAPSSDTASSILPGEAGLWTSVIQKIQNYSSRYISRPIVSTIRRQPPKSLK